MQVMATITTILGRTQHTVLRWSVLSLGLIGLLACSSQSATIQYYLLYSPEDTRQADLQDSQHVRLANLEIPDYLKPRGLPVMTQANQVHISKSHMWAESFEVSLEKLLQYALEPEFMLVNQSVETPTGLSLSIEILHLIPTQQGDVTISARYKVLRDGEILVNQAYSQKYPLREDGYGHTVDKFRHAIFELSQEIASQLRKL